MQRRCLWNSKERLEWKTEKDKNSALLIEGARRVGKTTIVKEFAENEYSNFIEIDFVAFIKGKMNAIEVKSTKRFTTSSLSSLKLKYPQLKFDKIVISPKTLSYDNDTTYLPIYLTFLL